jgi:hypothetical protein
LANESAGRRIRIAEHKTALMGSFEFELGRTSKAALGCDQGDAFSQRRAYTEVGATA